MSLSDLTPPPERVKPRLRQTFVWILLIAIGLTIAQWYYSEQVVPNQPIRFRSFDSARFDRLVRSDRYILVYVSSRSQEDNARLLESIHSPRVRKLIHRNGYMPIRVNPPVNDAERDKLLETWKLSELPALIFQVGSEDPRTFDVADEEAAVFEFLHEQRFGPTDEP